MRNKKGSITLFVLFSGLFFIMFLSTALMYGSIKRQTEIEATKKTEEIYGSQDQDEIYQSYFGEGAVPIYTKEQLFKIGSGENVQINEEGGKIYNFASDATYVIKNDLEFDYNGIWQMPEVTVSGTGQIKIKDTSKAEEVYYYYKNTNSFNTALTSENYIYDFMVLHYDGIKNTQEGHSSNTETWEDLSGNGYDGILNNFDNTTTSGWNAKAIALDGNDDGVFIGDNVKELFKSSNTIEMTFETYELANRAILIGNYAKLNNINFELTAYNTPRVYFNAGSIDSISDKFVYNEINKLYRISWVTDRENNAIKIYLNGELQDTISNSIIGSYNYDWTSVWLGRDERTGTTALKGDICSVRIYEQALAESDIKYNYKVDKLRYD